MNEKIKEVAEFDGWKHIEGKALMKHPNHGHYWHNEALPYLTSLDFLHPVAMKVLGQLLAYADRESHIIETAIKQACAKPPINGEYTALVDAVYDAIVYLKQHEPCQPK